MVVAEKEEEDFGPRGWVVTSWFRSVGAEVPADKESIPTFRSHYGLFHSNKVGSVIVMEMLMLMRMMDDDFLVWSGGYPSNSDLVISDWLSETAESLLGQTFRSPRTPPTAAGYQVQHAIPITPRPTRRPP